jgi:hypothetical protein
MTQEELQAIRELVNKVTDGPWEAHDTTVFAEGIDIGQFDFPEDAEFAAWCREGVPKLLDEVERLRSAIESVLEMQLSPELLGIPKSIVTPMSDVDPRDYDVCQDIMKGTRDLLLTPLRQALDGDPA